MKCPRCQYENPPGSNFCLGCGTRLGATCGACGHDLPAGSRFCNKCGAPVSGGESAGQARFASLESYTPKHLAEKILTSRSALEGERKQVTVLFADLKGSMELLADRDPEEARRLLDPVLERMMESVHHYEGTVNQVMGDGIMALLGAPIAHEDHAVRACYAALRMQEAIKRYAGETRRTQGVEVEIRVGLNSGEVVVRSIGSDLRMDYTAVGQTTHLAARMEQLASPGTTRLTADTLRLAEGYVAGDRADDSGSADRPAAGGGAAAPAGGLGDRQGHAVRPLAAIAEQSEEALRRGLAHLQEAEFLYETRLFPDLEYTFKHALTHEVTYGSLLQDRRRQLHAQIVAATERLYPDRLGEHVERLGHHARRGHLWDKAVRYGRQAGTRALDRSAAREALAHFEQARAALRELPESRERTEQFIDLCFEQRNALHALGEFARVGEVLNEGRALAEGLGGPATARVGTWASSAPLQRPWRARSGDRRGGRRVRHRRRGRRPRAARRRELLSRRGALVVGRPAPGPRRPARGYRPG